MPQRCTVLIAAADLLPALKRRSAAEDVDLVAFADVDALRALDAITARRPATVALERTFAATPRGAALINRIKADPALAQSAIVIVSHDAAPVAAPLPGSPAGAAQAPSGIAGRGASMPATPEPLDRGTRRAHRVAMDSGANILIDGNPAVLVDLSAVGAQVVSPTILKPNQRVRVTLSDEAGTWRGNGTIAWAAFEIPPRYRAGIDFLDADRPVIEAYARRHQSRAATD